MKRTEMRPCKKCGAYMGGDSELLRSAMTSAEAYVNGPLKARVQAGEILDPEASGLAFMIQEIGHRYKQVRP